MKNHLLKTVRQGLFSYHHHLRRISKMTELTENIENMAVEDDKVEEEEQVVNIETVVAKDNKGIDYMKLISKLFLFSWLTILLYTGTCTLKGRCTLKFR